MFKSYTSNASISQALLAPAGNKQFLSGENGNPSIAYRFAVPDSRTVSGRKDKNIAHIIGGGGGGAASIKAYMAAPKHTMGKVIVTLKKPGDLKIELIANELQQNGDEKKLLSAYTRKGRYNKEMAECEADIDIPNDFGEVGAIRVENYKWGSSEMFIESIAFISTSQNVDFSCKSWVSPKEKRIFFTTKSYLPSKTPSGLRRYRELELETLQGHGRENETRDMTDRVYDYDVYNDLGDPDKCETLKRPILGNSEEFPYPRRCRTGRIKTRNDPYSESRSTSVYVPRDEAFSEVKQSQFKLDTLIGVLHAVVPYAVGDVQTRGKEFPYFTAIDSLYNEAAHLPTTNPGTGFGGAVRRIAKYVADKAGSALYFDTPEFVNRDKFAWMRDVEFSRQTLAGINPCCIELVKEFPLKSTLDPREYGPQESVITKEVIEKRIKGFMSVDEALKQKKLFMLDYHDILLPYVEKVRNLGQSVLYGSRTLFYLTPDDTLMPVAIELTRPPMDGKPQWKQVFTPHWTATGDWLWKLARAHVLAHDSGIHQLVSHWLRTHCCTEPYIIAAHRQLSEMHPIYRLLHPHFRYTMEINALAREKLINADGVIEKTFSPLKYSMEISSVAYKQLWRFDHQALPEDLISRGMAERDPNAPHGLKLAIKDYPFANDGLIIWDILKTWVTDYVTHYYPEPNDIQSDSELQKWWTEVRMVGHADKKDEKWWPELKTSNDLIQTLTTIIWVASGHHAAVNFGQYDFAAYFPNRPTIARTTMPTEDPTKERSDLFIRRPEVELMRLFPSQEQAVYVMMILNVLSTHSPDEEYLGCNNQVEPAWKQEDAIKEAFERFHERLNELQETIRANNEDLKLKNRRGAGVVPYQLLQPFVENGGTSQGIPYSISI